MQRLTRVAAVFVVGAALASGQEADPSHKADEGKIRDLYWGYTLRFPTLRPLLLLGPRHQLIEAKTKDGIRVRLFVHESEAERTGIEWRTDAVARWKQNKRALLDLVEKRDRVFFREKKYGAFLAEHAYAYFVRGHQCFELHAWIDDRTSDSAKRIEKLIAAFKYDKDPGCGLRALDAAMQRSVSVMDKQAMVEGGIAYMAASPRGPAIPALAARILQRAAKLPGALDSDLAWAMHFYGGQALAHTAAYKTAAAWLAKAEATTDAAKQGAAAWEGARALARGGDQDGAFAALHRAFANGRQPVNKLTLSKDKALHSLREDPRWEQFWRQKVER